MTIDLPIQGYSGRGVGPELQAHRLFSSQSLSMEHGTVRQLGANRIGQNPLTAAQTSTAELPSIPI